MADLGVGRFLADGFALRPQLAAFLKLSEAELAEWLPSSTADLAALHPGAFDPERAANFYEEAVGTAHLLELAAWHLGSADYIADTLPFYGLVVWLRRWLDVPGEGAELGEG